MKKLKLLLPLILLLLFSGVAGAVQENIINASGVVDCDPNTNYGGFSRLNVVNNTAPCNWESYIELPIFSQPIYLNLWDGWTDADTIYIYSTSIFDENTITWNTKPARGALLTSFDITGVFGTWYNVYLPAPTQYIILVSTSTNLWGIFESDDGVVGLRPYINYTQPFDPSGYVNDTNGNYLANALVNISNATFSTSDFTDANGYWNVNIYEDATYTYNVSMKGYALLNGSQAFTMGGTNYNFTLTPSKGHISGNVYEWTADTPTKQSRPQLKDVKVEQNNGNQLYKIYAGSTLTWNGGYVFKVKDIDDGTHMTQIQLLLNGSVVDTAWIDEKDTYIYTLEETTDAVLYQTLYIDEVFTGKEADWIHAKPGYYIRAKGTAEKLIDFLIGLIAYPTFAPLITNVYLWDDFGAEKTNDFSQISGSTAVDEYYRVDFDFGTGDYNTIIAYYEGEKVSGTPKVCYYFSDDAMQSIPETSYCTQSIIIDGKQVYPTQAKDFNNLDADNDNIITMWLKIPSGYGVHNRYNVYASATCTNCNLKPLPDAIISYSTIPPVKSNSIGAYSLYLPFGNATVNFSKDGYESKNVTHWFNSTYPDYSYNVILNKTSSNATQPQYLLSIQPNPIVIGQAAQVIYQTLNEYSNYRITIHHAYQDEAVSVFDSDYGVIPNKNGYVDMPNYPIGEYTAYLSGSNGVWSLWQWTPVISTNFTVISNTPAVNWQLSEYYMGDIMKLDYYLPSGNQNITVRYPNGSILEQIMVSAAVNTSQTLSYNSLTLNLTAGVYSANISGNTAGSTTKLLSINVSNYTLSAPASVTWRSSFNIKYQSPKPSDLHIYNSAGVELITPKTVSGVGTYAFNTSSIENTAQTLTIKLIKDGIDKATAAVQVGSYTAPVSGDAAFSSLGNNLRSFMAMPAFWGLLITIFLFLVVGKTAPQAVGFGMFLILNVESIIGLYAPYTWYILAVTWIFAGIYFTLGRRVVTG